MQDDLTLIKKHYGEKMMHLCKTLFPTILETDGLLFRIISSKFAYSKLLYDDLIKYNKISEFQNYILSFAERDKNIHDTNLDPFKLMEMAGYELFECKTEADVRKFKKYYKPSEELCTFYANRTKDHYVFFAVKKNVDEIKRENFKMPERQDEYGTSVISIQFTRGKYNNLSIKNRYNHTVLKADATFSNNLDNIIPGLTDSFRKKYNLNIFFTDFDFEMNDYCYAKDGRYYKYNYCINAVCYGSNNEIITSNRIYKFDKEKYLIVDYFIIDLVNKKILLYDDGLKDSFIKLPTISKIIVTKNKNGKEIKIIMNDNYVILEINHNNQILSYNSNIPSIGDSFLFYNKTLCSFTDKSLQTIGDNFLTINNSLLNIDTPNLETVGDYFLHENTTLTDFDFPNLRSCGVSFLRCYNKEKISLPNIEKVGSSFLASNHMLSELYLPNIREIGSFFLNFNTRLQTLYAPKLEKIDHHFLTRNKKMESIYFPNLLYIDDYFMFDNTTIKHVDLPMVRKIGSYFLQHNYALKELNIPNVLEIGDHFLDKNRLLEKLNLPCVTRIKNDFLPVNDHLTTLNLPMLIIAGNDILDDNNSINEVYLPNLKICGMNFLPAIKRLKTGVINNNIIKGKYFFNTYFEKNNIEQKQLVKKLKN